MTENIKRSTVKVQITLTLLFVCFFGTGTGPLTRKDEQEGAEFLKALRALRAHGGGDCPELAFTGMANALEAGPQPGSSMFVFTDASAKDAEKKATVFNDAYDLDVKINFFTTSGCGSSGSLQPFHDVASKTGGLVYSLKTTTDLKQLGQLVSRPLQGCFSMSSGKSESSMGRKKRAADVEYKISVDDSIDKVTVSVTTHNSGSGISLIDPTGKPVTENRVGLSSGVVYNLESPITGVYRLKVPASAGKHTYKVSGVSGMNLDFGHYYVAIPKRGTRIPVPLDQPLKGMLTLFLMRS